MGLRISEPLWPEVHGLTPDSSMPSIRLRRIIRKQAPVRPGLYAMFTSALQFGGVVEGDRLTKAVRSIVERQMRAANDRRPEISDDRIRVQRSGRRFIGRLHSAACGRRSGMGLGKTERRGYDSLVVAVHISTKRHFDDNIRFWGDGGIQDEWSHGERGDTGVIPLYLHVFPDRELLPNTSWVTGSVPSTMLSAHCRSMGR